MPLAIFVRHLQTNLEPVVQLQLLAHSAKASLKIHPSTATSCSGFRKKLDMPQHDARWMHAPLVLATALSSEFQTISTCLSYIPTAVEGLNLSWEHYHTHDALVLLVLGTSASWAHLCSGLEAIPTILLAQRQGCKHRDQVLRLLLCFDVRCFVIFWDLYASVNFHDATRS